MRHAFTALSAVALLSLALPATAMAASSERVATLGGDIRLVALPAADDGTVRAMLDIRLEPGWKTYWRDPGGSGIPPSITVSGGMLADIGFPVPRHLAEGDIAFTGYDASVAFPLRLTDVSDGRLKASVFLGICKDICIPVQAELSVDTSGESFANPLEETAIAQAEARLPGRPSEDFDVLSAAWSADGKALSVRFKAPAAKDGALPDVFAWGSNDVQFGAAQPASDDGETYTAEIPVLHRSKNSVLSAAPIRLLVKSGDRSMETPLAID